MARHTVNTIADSLLDALEQAKTAAEKPAEVTGPVVTTELGREMLKVAGVLRATAHQDISLEDLTAFRRQHGI